MQASFPTRSPGYRLRRGDLLALGIALTVHAALLSVPLYRWQTGDQAARAIAVSLLTRTPVPPPPAEPDRAREKTHSSSASAEPPVSDRPEPGPTPDASPRSPPPQPAEATTAEDASRTVARLLDQLRRQPFAPPEADGQRKLGVLTPSPHPRNWRSGQVMEWRRPGGTPLPAQVEILDRWKAADGSHNVIVETPGGDLLCGRAEAWNPVSPLVEPVMMFKSCGRGKPTFEMERPYRER
ncbi:MAG: hypothetical protein PVJ33_08160 [Lysobacterales bacterium]